MSPRGEIIAFLAIPISPHDQFKRQATNIFGEHYAKGEFVGIPLCVMPLSKGARGPISDGSGIIDKQLATRKELKHSPIGYCSTKLGKATILDSLKFSNFKKLERRRREELYCCCVMSMVVSEPLSKTDRNLV